MPIGSIREYATATGKDYRTVYRRVEKGEFAFPDAELIEETKIVYRVKWKKPRAKNVK